MQINAVATFHKVSLENYIAEFPNSQKTLGEYIKIVEDIRLPHRSTHYSAGYDFHSPDDYILYPGGEVVIPTGIRVEFSDPYWVLMIFPRSGQSFRHGLYLANTVGVVDADYYYSDDEGQIRIKLRMPEKIGDVALEPLHIKKGEKFCQGIFLPYGITHNDDEDEKVSRNGGFGSTSHL